MSPGILHFLQLVVTGLVIGSVYALVALGFVLIYKATSVINFAQGEFVLVGAYVCLWVIMDFQIPFVWSFLITMVFSVLLGLMVERLMLRPLNDLVPPRATTRFRRMARPAARITPGSRSTRLEAEATTCPQLPFLADPTSSI